MLLANPTWIFPLDFEFCTLLFKHFLCGFLQAASGTSCLVHQRLCWDFQTFKDHPESWIR